MRPATQVMVTGVGATTPLGLSAAASCAAFRAAVSSIGELAVYAVDGELFDKEPVIGGRVPLEWFEGRPVEQEWPGHERFGIEPPPPKHRLVLPGVERLQEIAPPAAGEALHQSGLQPENAIGFGLYLGLDENEDAEPLVQTICSETGLVPAQVVIRKEGRAAGLSAVEAALGDLSSARVTGALVGGVDSQIRAPSLERLDAAGLLRSASRPEGIIPGEAAAFAVLETSASMSARGAVGLAQVLASGSAAEPTAGTDEPNQGIGLTQAIRQTRDDAGGLSAPPLVVCDLNGDRYRAQEWVFALQRTLGAIHGDFDIWHPADCIGDPGAASGVLNIVWATTAFVRGYAASDRVLVWGASEGPARVAILLGAAG